MRISRQHGRLPAVNGDGTYKDAPGGAGWVLGDRYQLVCQVGAGGMAVVWQAYDDVLARTVAVKLLAAQHADDPASRSRIRHEARAAAALSHPHIAQVHDYGEADVAGEVVPYVVMELVRGDTLQQRISAGPLLPHQAMRVCAEIAAALAAAHAEGLVHRDIKPANIMLSPTGAKVVDFGIAAAIRPSQADVENVEVLGTPAYLAPERLLHNAVEPASDVYALGVLLYRLLAGHSPWTSETTTQMLTAHIYIDPVPLLPMFQVPDYVTALCNRCLAKDPAGRPSAREVAALLAQGAAKAAIGDELHAQQPAPGDDFDASSAGPAVMDQHLPDGNDPVAVQPASPDANSHDRPAEYATARTSASDAAQATTTSRPGSEGTPSPRRRRRVMYALAAAVLLAAITTTMWILHSSRPGATARTPSVGVPPPSATVMNSPPAVSISPAAPATGGTEVSPKGAAETATSRVTPGPATPGDPHPTTRAAAPAVSTPEPDASTTTAAPAERTLTSAAGSVRATCPATDTAQILSWSATKPYKVIDGDTEAGPSPEVSFKHGNTQVTMTITCSGGVPSATDS
jgi:serine/threonine-protein kinase